MKLETQVTNLEISRKLKELGVNQESLYVWIKFLSTIEVVPKLDAGILQYGENLASAFTVAELGELLPDFIEVDSANWTLTIEI